MARAHVQRLVVLATAGVLLLATAACGGGTSNKTTSSGAASSAETALTAAKAKQESHIAFLVERAAGDPLDVFSLNSLAIEYMQRARETGDVSDLTRAEDALTRSLKIRLNDNYEGIALLAAIATTKHDFARGLALAQQAIPLKPKQAYGYGVLGDALMGLGRYDEADFAYEKMIDISADISAFGRRALLFQTRGDIDSAESSWREAIRRAASPDDGVPEHLAWAHAQLASLYFAVGRIDDAQRNYEQSLSAFPGYVHALAGEGRVAGARGDHEKAIADYTNAVNTVPLPEYVIALGDVDAAAGDTKGAQDQYALVGAIEQLYASNGVNLDLQIGLFNADHGRNVAATVERAVSAYAQQPSIQAADALAWVQYKAGNIDAARDAIASALRTGTRDPLINFHAGMIYKLAGDSAASVRYLTVVQKQNPNFSVLYAGAARSALDELRGQARND